MSQDPQSPASDAKNDPVPLTAEEAAAREAARRAALPEIARRALEDARSSQGSIMAFLAQLGSAPIFSEFFFWA